MSSTKCIRSHVTAIAVTASRFRHSLALLLACVVLQVTSPPTLAAMSDSDPGQSGRAIKVMTRNLDEGTDYLEALGATTPAEFLAGVSFIIQNVRATNPPARMAAIAREIAEEQPDLVGVQEATRWQTGPAPGSLTTEFDLLQLLQDELGNQGQQYALIAEITQFDLTAPSSLGIYVRATNRIAVLARADLNPKDFQISNVQKANFTTNLTLTHPVLGIITVPRAWISADVRFQERQFRFVTAHPEAVAPPVQIAQGMELLQGPANTSLPVIMAADFNSTADDPSDPTYPTYSNFITAGFLDAWTKANPKTPGFTCCQDENLANPLSALTHRLDLVLARGDFRVRKVELVGNDPVDRVFGVWPADHAGVTGSLRLPAQD